MELLAPAGSIAALKAAVLAGADAVYLGLGEHNARLKSSDFNAENIQEWIAYAHLFGVKVHVTLNTAIKGKEMDRALRLAEISVKSGADALIVSDLGLFRRLKRITNVPLHLSTQAGVQNKYDAVFASSLGADRVILSRETVDADIPQIKAISKEVERFVQGAVCVSFSGACLLGAVEYGSSGNRGVCNQACRLFYTATDEKGRVLKKGYLLSPFDLSLGKDATKQEGLGVSSLKIEGRLKRPAYVYYSTKYYRAVLDGNEGDAENALLELKKSFNRGFFPGYTLKKSDSVISTRLPSHAGVAVGIIEKIVEKHGFKIAFLRSSHSFRKGDGAKIVRNGEEVGGSEVTSVVYDGEFCGIPVSSAVQKGDEVCLTTDSEKIEEIEKGERKLPLRVTVRGEVGKPLSLIGESGGLSVTVKSERMLDKSNATSNEALLSKLTKFGSTHFYLSSLKDETKSPVFLQLSEVNELRRKLVASLREAIIKARSPSFYFRNEIASSAPVLKKKGILAEVESERQIEYAKNASAYVFDPVSYDSNAIRNMLIAAQGKKCYLRLPKIARNSDLVFFENVLKEFPTMNVYADNLYSVTIARSLNRSYIVGFGQNVFNEDTASVFSDADYVGAAIEEGGYGNLRFCGGKIPLMHFAHCPVSVCLDTSCDTCKKNVDRLYYSNGEKKYLIRRTERNNCQFSMFQDRLTILRPIENAASFYSFVGLNEDEIRRLSEEMWKKA